MTPPGSRAGLGLGAGFWVGSEEGVRLAVTSIQPTLRTRAIRQK